MWVSGASPTCPTMRRVQRPTPSRGRSRLIRCPSNLAQLCLEVRQMRHLQRRQVLTNCPSTSDHSYLPCSPAPPSPACSPHRSPRTASLRRRGGDQRPAQASLGYGSPFPRGVRLYIPGSSKDPSSPPTHPVLYLRGPSACRCSPFNFDFTDSSSRAPTEPPSPPSRPHGRRPRPLRLTVWDRDAVGGRGRGTHGRRWPRGKPHNTGGRRSLNSQRAG